MKYLVILLLLINCLAFFMFSHIQKQGALAESVVADQTAKPLVSPKPLVLLTELTDDQLQALDPTPEGEEKDGHCEFVGPFEDESLATAALEVLLAGGGSPEMVVNMPETPGFWLKIPSHQSADITDELWSQYERKKRYKEGCMKVANKRQFQ